jgi:hypothetical protein
MTLLCGGTTGAQVVAIGTLTLTEAAAAGTDLTRHTTRIDCGSGPVSGISVTLTLVAGLAVTCTMTNSRGNQPPPGPPPRP